MSHRDAHGGVRYAGQDGRRRGSRRTMRVYCAGPPPIDFTDTQAWTLNHATRQWSFRLPETLPEWEGLEFTGAFPAPEEASATGLEGLAAAQVVFFWEPRTAQDFALMGAAQALGIPLWVYTTQPLEPLAVRLSTMFRGADSAEEALEAFALEAPPVIRLAAQVREARAELSSYVKGMDRRRPMALSRGKVYLLQAGSVFKIGMTTDLNKRLDQLAIQLPKRGALVHAFSADYAAAGEHFLHRVFRDKRRNGEWFELTPEDVAWIKGLRDWSLREWVG